MPKVSIIIPVYNVEQYLARCLDSVLAQTFKDIEVICVNDGSTDNSSKILVEYSQKDNRIKLITQKNQGLSEARNNGLKQAVGEYIYFLDSDDAIEAQTIEICYQTATKYKAELVCFEYKKSNGKEIPHEIFDINNISAKIYSNPLFNGCHGKNRIPFNVWTKFYKKSLLDNIKFIKGIQFEDYPYTYAILGKHPKTALLPLKLHLYTRNINSISHQKSTPKQISDYWMGISSVVSLYSQKGLKKELEFFKKDGLPRLLKHQYDKCLHASSDMSNEMWQVFRDELFELKQKGMLSHKGHSLWRYYQYKKLLKNKPKNDIKIAVQMFGHLRTFEKCASSLQKNLIDLYDCDVFMHTWDETEHRTQTHHKNKSKVKKVDAEFIEKLKKLYSLKSIKVEHQNVQDMGNIQCQCNKKSKISVFGLSCMYHSQNEVNNLRKQYQKEHNIAYDYVIFIRPDICLNRPFILDTLNKELILTKQNKENIKFAAHGRYINDFALSTDAGTDILFVATPNTADCICETLQHIDFSKYEDSLWNPENMVTQELEKQNIKTYPLMYQGNTDWFIFREKKILKNLLKLKLGKNSYLSIFAFLPHLFHAEIKIFQFKISASIGALDS